MAVDRGARNDTRQRRAIQALGAALGVAGPVPDNRQILTGAGLTGGGDLSVDRTHSILLGTTPGLSTASGLVILLDTTPGLQLGAGGLSAKLKASGNLSVDSNGLFAPVFVASGASHAAGVVPDPGASAGTTAFLREDATWFDLPSPVGTVTSVALTMPSIFSVAGSPVTTSGTLAVTLATEAANKVFAGPTTGADATPTFRSIVAGDLPANVAYLDAIQEFTGTNTFKGGAFYLKHSASSFTTRLYYNTAPSANREINVPDVDGTWCIAATSTSPTNALFATAVAGAPAFRDIAKTDLPSTIAYEDESNTFSGTNNLFTGNFQLQVLNTGTGDTAPITIAMATTAATPTAKTYFISFNAVDTATLIAAPLSTTPTHALFATAISGAPAFRALAATDLPSLTSAQLATIVTDETGSGALVFATSPSLVTPTLGVASATSINKVTITAPATGSTLTLADGKTFTVSNTLTFTGIDSSIVAFGAGGTVAYIATAQTWSADQTFLTGNFKLRNPANTFSVTLNSGAITANRTITLPTNTGTLIAPAVSTTSTKLLVDTNPPGWQQIDRNFINDVVAYLDGGDPFTNTQFFDEGISINEGTNKTMGVATLVGGTVTVNTTKVTANSRIFLTVQSLGTITVPKAVAVTARSAGTSFTITSADATDTSVVAWLLVEPY